MPVDVTTQAYRPELRATVEAFVRPGDEPGPPAPGGSWTALLDAPELHCDALVVATDAEGGVGIASALLRPMCGGAARAIQFVLPGREDKALAFARALDRAMSAALHEKGVRQRIIFVPDNAPIMSRLVAEAGYELEASCLCLEWEYHGAGFPERPVPGVTLSFYEGGDDRLNEQISGLVGRAFARDSLFPTLPATTIASLAGTGAAWFGVAREIATGDVVGAAEVNSSGFFTSLAVARRFWGTGLADWLGPATCNELVRRGHTRLESIVRVTNRAAIALHERFGWRRSGTLDIFAAPPLRR